MTEQQYNDAIAIYNPNGGHRTGKIYDLKGNDLTVTGGGGTRINKDGLVEDIVRNYFTKSHDIISCFNGSTNATLSIESNSNFRGFPYYRITESTADGLHGIYTGNTGWRRQAQRTIHVKKGNRRYIRIGFRDYIDQGMLFDFDTGTFSFSVDGTYNLDYSVNELEDGWFQVNMLTNNTSGLSDSFTISLTAPDNSQNSSYIGTDGYVFVAHAQVVIEPTEIVPYQVTTGSAAFPKIDYSTGKPAFLIEPARTNYEVQSYNLPANVYWGTPTNGEVILNEVGITGEANTAPTLSDTSTSDYGEISRSIMALALGNYKLSVWVKKDNNESRFPEFFIRFRIGGVNANSLLQLNTKTGVAAIRSPETYDQLEYHIIDRGSWWEIVWIAPNTDRLATFTIRPSFSNTLGGAVTNSLTGSIIIGHVGVYNSTVVDETPIITNGAAVTRTGSHYFIENTSGLHTSVSDPLIIYGEIEGDDFSYNQEIFGGGTITPTYPRMSMGLGIRNGQYYMHIRPSNTQFSHQDTGISTPHIKFAMSMRQPTYKLFINGVKVVDYNDTGYNSWQTTLQRMAFGKSVGMDSTSIPNYNGRFYDIRMLSSNSTDQELIDITTI